MTEIDSKDLWIEAFRDEQQDMFNWFGAVDWDMYGHNELHVLENKVAIMLYGPNLEDSSNDDNLEDPKMTVEENKKREEETKKIEEEMKKRKVYVEQICRLIVEEGTKDFSPESTSTEKNAYMAFIFVYWMDKDGNQGCWPVFRVPNDNTGLSASFIDLNCRVYSSWQDFLENNQFPACEYCYPRDGKYQCTPEGDVIVEFGTSPASAVSKKVLNALDIASTGVAAAGTVVTIASLAFPLAAPLLAASSIAMGGVSGYSIFRSSTTLYDRSTHKQSIGVGDKDARGCYISILASTIGFGASAATSATVRMAQNGQVMGRLATSAVTALNGGALVMNGVGVINSFHHLVAKHQDGELTAFDVAQFSASLLLFCHSTVNFKTAQTIIESTQNQEINNFRDGLRSNRHRKMLDKSLKNTVQDYGNTDGKALTIRSIKNIDNVDDFFAALVQTDKQVRYVKGKIVFADGGTVLINNKLNIDPRQLAALNKEQRVTVLRAAQRFNFNRMSAARFNDITNNLIKDIPNAPTSNLLLSDVPGNMDFRSDRTHDNTIMRYLTGLLSVSQLSELNDILNRFSGQFHNIILQLSMYLFKKLNQKSGNQYMDFFQFVCKYVEHLMFYIVDDKRKFILGALGSRIRSVSPENMTNSEYCLAILEQLILDPTVLLGIFQRIKLLFEVLQEGIHLRENERKVNFLELVSVASTLMHLEGPMWLQVIEYARITSHALGYENFSFLVAIVKDLCLYVEKVALDMEERYGSYTEFEGDGDFDYDDDNDDHNDISKNSMKQYKGYCALAIESFNDPDVTKCLHDQIYENIKESFTNDKSINNVQRSSSQDTPLVLEKCFFSEGRTELLSENEIIEVCKQALKTDIIPKNYVIQCEGLKYFIVMEEKLITLKCDVEVGSVTVHVDWNAFSVTPNIDADVTGMNNDCINILLEKNHFEYTKEQPLILKKPFWVNGENELLSQEEIYSICKKTLKVNNMPEECAIDYDGLNIFISVEDKIVTIECDVQADRLCTYVSPSPVLSIPVQNPNCISDTELLGDTQWCYSEEVPLVVTKHFCNPHQSELLSTEEIFGLCQETLNIQNMPQKCTIEFHGQKILVSVEGKVVVLKCDVENDKIYSYVDHTAILSTVTEEYDECINNRNTIAPLEYQTIYTKENPMVMTKDFEAHTQCELLSEEEIFNICKIIFSESQLLQNASFEYYGSNIFVYVNDKTITIECDICNGRIYAYMQNISTPS